MVKASVMKARVKRLLRVLRDRSIRTISRWLETNDYSSSFADARVVLLGPNCLFDEQDRARIADADICIVMNKGRNLAIYPAVKALCGKIAYFHCLDENSLWGGGPLDTVELRRAGFRELFFPLADMRMEINVEQFHAKNRGLLPLRRIAKSVYADIERRLAGYRPTSGLAIIGSLAAVKGCKLYVTGITFYRKAYMPEYSSHLLDLESIKRQMEGHGIHHPDREFIEFMRLKRAHDIEVDAQLEAILALPYAPLFYTDPGDERIVHSPAEVAE